MATIIQSDKIATNHLGTAESFGLYVPAWLEGTYSAAYSLRRLRQAYTGPLLRVRNNTNNATAEVTTATGRYAIDSTARCTIVAAGTSGYSIGQVMTLATFASTNNVTVQRWYDQSGNGRYLAAWSGDTTQEPTLLTAGAFTYVDGRPVIAFNGTSNRLEVNATVSVAWVDAQPFSVLASVKVQTSANYLAIWDRKTNGVASTAGNFLARPDNTTNDNRAINAGVRLDDAYAGPHDGGKHRVYAARYNGASSKIWVDGVETASGNAGTNIPGDFRIGVEYYGANYAHQYQEVLVLPSGTEDMGALSAKVMAYHGLA
jgi:hypothetical protein